MPDPTANQALPVSELEERADAFIAAGRQKVLDALHGAEGRTAAELPALARTYIFPAFHALIQHISDYLHPVPAPPVAEEASPAVPADPTAVPADDKPII